MLISPIYRGINVIDVVLDPQLSNLMRKHQKEGVKVHYLPQPISAYADVTRSSCTLV